MRVFRGLHADHGEAATIGAHEIRIVFPEAADEPTDGAASEPSSDTSILQCGGCLELSIADGADRPGDEMHLTCTFIAVAAFAAGLVLSPGLRRRTLAHPAKPSEVPRIDAPPPPPRWTTDGHLMAPVDHAERPPVTPTGRPQGATA